MKKMQRITNWIFCFCLLGLGFLPATVGQQILFNVTTNWETNSHFYSFFTFNQPVTWNFGNTFCLQRGGYLATITSSEEQSFVRDFYLLNQHSLCSFSILGGFQDTSSSQYNEPSGGWRWVTPEPWNFTFWGAQSSTGSLDEPNDGDRGGCCENFLYYNAFYSPVRYRNHPNGDGWNDGPTNGSACSLICELETPQNCNHFLYF